MAERVGNRGSQLDPYRRLGIGAAVTIVVMVLVAAVGGPSGHRAPAPRPASPAAATATDVTGAAAVSGTPSPRVPATPSPAGTTAAPAVTATTDPGLLPQTDVKPDAASAAFTAHVSSLWAAIVADDPSRAMPSFFPLEAYKQVKALADPERDWNTRLVAAFAEDIHAWHAQLGSGAASAQLTAVSVPSDQAQWIGPGTESNKGSYWRLYGSTLGYTVDGRAGTFTVASMISWRGEWFVVHLASIR